MFVDILSFCSFSVLFCLFLHPTSFIFYVFLFLSLITCTIFIGDTITAIPCLFNYKCLMFKSTLIVVRQPSGYMVRAFHWQYGDILLAIYFFVFTYYFVLSLKNKYTILYYTCLSTSMTLVYTRRSIMETETSTFNTFCMVNIIVNSFSRVVTLQLYFCAGVFICTVFNFHRK